MFLLQKNHELHQSESVKFWLFEAIFVKKTLYCILYCNVQYKIIYVFIYLIQVMWPAKGMT